jgi:hypothetical protein
MKKLLVIIVLFIFVYSCQSETERINTEKPKIDIKNVDSSNIEILFNETTFSSETELKLLKELGLGMCDPNQKDLSNYKVPACDPKFFKFISFNKNTPLKNGFLLLVKSMVHDFPLRRLFVFQRIDGKLEKVNGFIANLIGKRPSKSGYEDLVLRFRDEDQNFFNCIYVWNINHYEFDRVEQINDANIKAIYQDSMNLDIQKMIELKRLQF